MAAERKPKPAAKTSTERVRAFRARMRAKGMRKIEFWVPDVNSPEFVAQAHRDSLAIANSPYEADDQAFVDSISIINDPEFDNEWR
ncbi:MAG TPA: antitoxin MazE family protein [Chloroflexota bacterium]